MTSDLSALIARLEAAEAGSRELDALICCALHDGPDWAKEPYYPLGSHGLYSVGRGGPGLTAECYTASLDAALALAERVLDGDLSYDLFHDFGGFNRAKVHGITDGPVSGEGKGETMPLALCIAILRAIQHGYEANGVVSPNLNPKAQGEGR